MSRGRTLVVDAGGLVGGLAGAGLSALIMNGDDSRIILGATALGMLGGLSI